MTLETTPAQLLSDHTHLQPSSLRVVNSQTQLESLPVRERELMKYMLYNVFNLLAGIYFSLRSKSYSDSSDILIADIGEGDIGALLCFTDLTQCCRNSDTPTGVGVLGQWLYPNGSAVSAESDEDFYIDRGPSVVRLHRRSNASSPTGRFCCMIPDATSANMKICANIGE